MSVQKIHIAYRDVSVQMEKQQLLITKKKIDV